MRAAVCVKVYTLEKRLDATRAWYKKPDFICAPKRADGSNYGEKRAGETDFPVISDDARR